MKTVKINRDSMSSRDRAVVYNGDPTVFLPNGTQILFSSDLEAKIVADLINLLAVNVNND